MNPPVLKKLTAFYIFIFLFIQSGYSQITVVSNQTALQLVQKLTGTGVTVSNATLTCPSLANGSFTTVSSNLNLSDGIILTSGKATNAVGPYSQNLSTANGALGDADLTTLIGATTKDACKLEFDFVPTGDTVKFRYVFGSEEYPGFACTSFNDVFGFFISGPGYSSAKNIALIPGTTIPVAINSTAGVVGTAGGSIGTCNSMGTGSPFTQYYVNNTGGTTVAYDGFTTVFTAIAEVVPCSTYHLKLAVADVQDESVDSGVFLEAGSFTSNLLSVNTNSNLQAPVPYCVRGCKNGTFSFKRQKVTGLPLTVKYQIAGNAINGTDYTTIPDSVIIAANDSDTVRTIIPLTTATGTKKVKLYIFSPFSCSMSTTIYDSSEITIFDSLYTQIATPDTGVCPGGSMPIQIVGDPGFVYSWSPATGLSSTTIKNPVATPTSATTYFVTATLPNSTCATVHDNISISIYSPPNITVEPRDTSVCNTAAANFSVTATGTELAYQWQIKNGTVFNNLVNGSPYSGVTTSTLTVSPMSSSLSGKIYRCIVSGKCVPKDTSAQATLSMLAAPGITSSPVNKTICEGDNTTFAASGTGPGLNYQWQVNTGSSFTNIGNGGVYSGATTNTLTITGATGSMDGYQYRCIANGTCSPSANSSAATLTVYKLPHVTTQPQNTHTCPDSPANFSITATGTYITYQWQANTGSGYNNLSDNSTYSGTATNALHLSAAPASMHNYQYRCIVNGICYPSDTSSGAKLTIDTLPDVTTQPVDTTICEYSNGAFKIATAGTNLTYQWQLNTGSGFNNLNDNATYSGTHASQLQITSATYSMNGYLYRCIIAGYCNPRDTSAPAALHINTLPNVTSNPTDSTVCEGTNAAFKVTATGTGLTYQWQTFDGSSFNNISNNSVYSGVTTNTLLLTAPPASLTGSFFRCVVSGTCAPPANSSNAILTVYELPDVTLQAKDTAICEGNNAGFNITAKGMAIGYQWQVNNGAGFADITNNSTYSGATSNALGISAIPASMNGYQYRCIVSGICTPPDTSIARTLTVNTSPNITLHPQDSILCEGANAAFKVAATGTGLVYQWQVNTGSGYTNVSNNSIYSGANSNILQLTAPPPSMNGYMYQCIISGVCTPAVTSAFALLTVRALPDISLQPKDSTICEGNNAAFNIAATGTSITYQWQVNTGSGYTNVSNNSTYAGAATNTLNISAIPAAMNNYKYRCIVFGICTPPDTSSIATLTVNTSPNITLQPKDSILCEGSNAAFKITATGSALVYQWQVNTGSGYTNVSNTGMYTGANTNTLNITGATTSMSGYLYKCVVTGVCTPAQTSSAATLTVRALPDVTLQPKDSTVCEGNNAAFRITATGTTITYQWQVNTGSGFANVANNSTYTGATTNTLNLAAIPFAMNNYRYRCIVSGICTPPDTSSVATLTVSTLPDVTSQPKDTTVCEGSNGAFSITATGTSITYQWQVNAGSGYTNVVNNSTYTGATANTLNIASTPFTMNGYKYRCLVAGACLPPDTSAIATLTVNTLPDITLQPKDSIVCEGNNATFNISATGTAITYQWQVNTGSGFTNVINNSTYAGAATNTLAVSAITFALNNNTYRCIVTGVCTPPDTSAIATLTVNTLPDITLQPKDSTVCVGSDAAFNISATGTGISYQWQVNNGTGYTNVVNNSTYTGATTNHLGIFATTVPMDNYLYRCIVSGTCTPPDTSSAAVLHISTPPAITTPPAATQICEGGDALFSLGATGTNLKYQWQVNTGSGYTDISDGSLYSGTHTNALLVMGVTSAMSGYLYQCIISGDCPPSVTSGALTLVLTVFTKPAITSSPVDRKICEGTNTSFSSSATGTGINYQWQVDTGTGTYIPVVNNSINSGATTGTLNITGATINMSGYKYRCVAKGVCLPDGISQVATLTVDTLPVIFTEPKDTTVCEGNGAAFALVAAGTNRTYQWQINTGTGFINVPASGIYSGANTGTLKISAAVFPMNNYQYRCIINGLCAPPDTSAIVALHVNTLPDITLQPKDSIVCEGNNAAFNITATGTAITYQWQVNAGSGFANVVNNSTYTGATTNTLSLAAIPFAMNNYKYRCIVTGICTPPDTSSVVNLTVNTLPDITLQPKDSIICEGNNAAFKITATGTAITYQWQVNTGSGFANVVNNSTYTGATTNTLNLATIPFAMNNYKYRCIVTGICTPPDTSTVVNLTVNTLPDITLQPKDSTVCEGNNAAFKITATGTAITYQWQVNTGSGYTNVANNSTYTGATTNTLNLATIPFAMNNYKYRCIVTGICTPPDTSTVVNLTVNTLPDITLQPKDSTVCEGNNAAFKITATGTAITYQWQVNTGSGYTNVANNSTYTGATTNTLNLAVIPFAMNGYKYRCIVTGICTPPDTSTVANLTVNTLPDITSQPKDSTVCEGNNAAFSITATGTAITYQWQVNTGSGFANVVNNSTYTGATTNTLNLATIPFAMNGYKYRCIVKGICTLPDTSTIVNLTVNTLPDITLQPKDSIVCEGNNAAFSIAATGTSITYKWQVNAGSGFADVVNNSTYTGAATNTLNVSTIPFAMNNYLYRCIVTGICTPPDTSAVAKLMVNTSPVITGNPVNSNVCNGDTTSFAIAANGTALTYRWQVDTGFGYNDVANSTLYSGATTGTLTLYGVNVAMTGFSYRCIVSGTCPPPDTSTPATLTVYTRPAIVSNPHDTTVCPDNIVSFKVLATGTLVTYQWQVNTGAGFTDITNNAVYTGATANKLVITNTTYSMNGYTYRCIVSGICTPSVQSATASLKVNPGAEAIITKDGATTFCNGGSVVLNSQVQNAVNYQWQRNNNIIANGIDPKLIVRTSGSYKLIVYNGYCYATSSPVDVTVNPVPGAGIEVTGPAIICKDSTVLLSVTGSHNDSYQWEQNNITIEGANSGHYNVYFPGSYRVIATNTFGCSDTSDRLYIEADEIPDPFINTDNIYLCTGDYYTSYQWYMNQDPVTGATTNCYLPKANGAYTVVTTDSKGCSRRAKDYLMHKVIVIWPNPTSGIVNIITDESITIRVTDMAGKTVMKESNSRQIDISEFADGMYMLKVYDRYNTLMKAEKIIKSNR